MWISKYDYNRLLFSFMCEITYRSILYVYTYKGTDVLPTIIYEVCVCEKYVSRILEIEK